LNKWWYSMRPMGLFIFQRIWHKAVRGKAAKIIHPRKNWKHAI